MMRAIFEGTEADGRRYRWHAQISAPSASDAPSTVFVTKTLLDTTGPTVEIRNAPASLAGATPFTVTARFSEDVFNFDLSDIVVTNGQAHALVELDRATYTLHLVSTGTGPVTIDIPAGAAEDAAGNLSAATQLVIGDTTVSDAQRLIRDFMSERAGLIVLSQPDLVARLARGWPGAEAPLGAFAAGHPDAFTLGFSTSLSALDSPALAEVMRATAAEGEAGYAPFDIWVDGKWAHANSATAATDFALVRIGADYLLTPDLLVGVMGHLDWTAQSGAGGTFLADGLGWMAGPYVVARLDEHLYFNASLQGGASANRVSPLGTSLDAFTTTRWLAKAQLTGDFALGALTVSPILAGSYFSETQAAYTDGFGNTVPSQTIGAASVDFGPRVGYVIAGEGVEARPSLGLIGSWRHESDGTSTTSGWAARLEGGLDLRFAAGASFAANAFYAGLGGTGREAYGGGLSLRVPIN